MNKKKSIKKIFSDQIKDGFRFTYSNWENTIMEYCLIKEDICICFTEDYRHEFLDMEVVRNSIKLIHTDGMVCFSEVPCIKKKELESQLKRMYSCTMREGIALPLTDTQWVEWVQVYFDFLEENKFFL